MSQSLRFCFCSCFCCWRRSLFSSTRSGTGVSLAGCSSSLSNATYNADCRVSTTDGLAGSSALQLARWRRQSRGPRCAAAAAYFRSEVCSAASRPTRLRPGLPSPSPDGGDGMVLPPPEAAAGGATAAAARRWSVAAAGRRVVARNAGGGGPTRAPAPLRVHATAAAELRRRRGSTFRLPDDNGARSASSAAGLLPSDRPTDSDATRASSTRADTAAAAAFRQNTSEPEREREREREPARHTGGQQVRTAAGQHCHRCVVDGSAVTRCVLVACVRTYHVHRQLSTPPANACIALHCKRRERHAFGSVDCWPTAACHCDRAIIRDQDQL